MFILFQAMQMFLISVSGLCLVDYNNSSLIKKQSDNII